MDQPFRTKLSEREESHAHTNAETQLAIWNVYHGISLIPATIGTLARKGPRKRAITIAQAPHLLKNALTLLDQMRMVLERPHVLDRSW